MTLPMREPWFDRALFSEWATNVGVLPILWARSHHWTLRVLALLVYLPWVLCVFAPFMLLVILPLLMLSTVHSMWCDMRGDHR